MYGYGRIGVYMALASGVFHRSLGVAAATKRSHSGRKERHACLPSCVDCGCIILHCM